MDFDREIEFCRNRERVERVAASIATNLEIHDAHFVMAERYADRAASLVERQFEGKVSHGEEGLA